MVEVAGLEPAVLEALVNLVVVLADNKYWLGRRLSEWTAGAPQLEVATAAAAIAQEELGHARVLYPLLAELPVPARPAPLERETDRAEHYNLSFLDRPWESWVDAVAALALIDPALTAVLEAAAGSEYRALARRAERMVAEEYFHLEFAEGRVREPAETPTLRTALQARVDRVLPEVLCWFGPAGEPGLEALRAAGVISLDGQGLLQAYLGRVTPLLLEAGIKVPLVRWCLARKTWEVVGGLPWQLWDPKRRRWRAPATNPTG